MKGARGWNPQLADVWSKLHETDGLRITGGEVVGDGTPSPRVTVTWAARLLTLPAVILSVSPVPSKLLVVKTPFALTLMTLLLLGALLLPLLTVLLPMMFP